eukprot:gb/GEZJ01006420.1/.p2 GENE.gb/GEZJ01006420.1/~~gb/GEZJ01006420.1/.p2  ORF type:complete len:165 (-),score=24.19 gb/GEZJ01006420.1/:21-515(-)
MMVISGQCFFKEDGEDDCGGEGEEEDDGCRNDTVNNSSGLGSVVSPGLPLVRKSLKRRQADDRTGDLMEIFNTSIVQEKESREEDRERIEREIIEQRERREGREEERKIREDMRADEREFRKQQMEEEKLRRAGERSSRESFMQMMMLLVAKGTATNGTPCSSK